ncbi:MAG TPA: efflux RND transporter permease subunit [Candidatus Dormibacteraeota bacterium]|nr:efflux RND transporter permease subunit [Candidatus Dormibacteraeota bacterium]
MRAVIRWCLGNRAVVILFAAILMAGGVFSLTRIDEELLPSIQFPAVFVLIPDPGAGPEQVDRDLSQPLDAELEGLPGATHVTSTSSQGYSEVAVEFGLDSSLQQDQEAVNQRLAQVQLPAGAGRPIVQTFDFSSAPSMTYSLAARDGDLARATREANQVIVPALRDARDVAQVRVSGGARRVIMITLDPARMVARGVTLPQVQQALSAAQVDLPAGESLQGGRSLPVTVHGRLQTLADLRALPLGAAPVARGAGPPAPVRLGDVARVEETSAPVNGISRTDGLPSLEIQIIRAPNGNAVALSNDIRRRVAGLHLSREDDLRLVDDAADDIRASLNDLLLEGLLGALLAVLVIFLFLRSLRATLVTAVSLPTSVLVAVLGTDLSGYSLNVLTLAGLTIAVGRIVDDAIVVLENGYRHLQSGETPMEAALNGAAEVASPVISSTLTTVAVFLPIGVVGGIVSRFFLPFSLTVTISLLASLLVALTVIPVLVSLVLRRARVRPTTPAPGPPGLLARLYWPLLTWVLDRAWRKAGVLLTALTLLAGSLVTLAALPRNILDLGGSTQLTGTVTLPPGTTAPETDARLLPFERAAMADPAVRTVQVSIGSSDYGAYTAAASSNVARLSIRLRSKAGAALVADRLRRRLDRLYGSANAQLAVSSFGPSSNGFQATLRGTNPADLRRASDAVVAALSHDRELTNVKSSLAAAKPELDVAVDPARAAAYGLTPQTVAAAVAAALDTRDVGSLGTEALQLRLDPGATTADRLPELPLGPGVVLGEVATVTETMAPVTITRTDGAQEVTVTADVTVPDTQGAIQRATRRLDRLSLPAGVGLGSGSSNQELENAFTQMVVAIGVAVAIVFVILVTFFRSLVTPLVILLTMPLALIGGLLALYLFRQALGLPALLGVLMLLGIVVSNAILLVDFVERNRAEHELNQALALAGSVRIRPILMTALATIVALVPVASGLSTAGGGGLISQPLALVVEGGLISSTFLTLVVIPVVYSVLRRRSGGTRPGAGRLPAGPGPSPEVSGEVPER